MTKAARSIAARAELTPFYGWTVYIRASVIVFFAAMVWMQLAPPMLLLFGLVDLQAAGWTATSLRADARLVESART